MNRDGTLPRLPVIRKTGGEHFCDGARQLDFTVLDFWQWSTSDLVSNATRGRVAEYIVARALGVDTTGVRNEWDAFDLSTPSGIKVEVKSAAYVQSWFQKRVSAISFLVPKRRFWDAETNLLDKIPRRHADIYVLALLANQDKKSLNPLDLSQWEFYVLPTAALNQRKRSQHSITLKSLKAMCDAVPFAALRARVEAAAVENNKKSSARAQSAAASK